MLRKDDVENMFEQYRSQFKVNVEECCDIKANFKVIFYFINDGVTETPLEVEDTIKQEVRKQLDRFTKHYSFKYRLVKITFSHSSFLEVFLYRITLK